MLDISFYHVPVPWLHPGLRVLARDLGVHVCNTEASCSENALLSTVCAFLYLHVLWGAFWFLA